MPHAKQIGQRIRKLRTDRGLTQAVVAEAVGIERPSLSMLENGHDTAGLATLQAIADYFGVTLDFLQRGEAAVGVVQGGRYVQEPDQISLLALWDSLSPEDKVALARTAHGMALAGKPVRRRTKRA